MRGSARWRWAFRAILALVVVPGLAFGAPRKHARKASKKPGCAEADRTYFQQLPPAPVWPKYEAMEIELTEGKGGRCNLRMVVTEKESLELLAYRATCRKVGQAYRCHGESGTGAVWFTAAGRGTHRQMTLHLPDPGIVLTGLTSRDLVEHLRTPRGPIVVELPLTRDARSDDRS